MKAAMIILIAATLAMTGWVFTPRTHWYLEPTSDRKWRACGETTDWRGTAGGCGSPTTIDDAEWQVRTEGGTKVRR